MTTSGESSPRAELTTEPGMLIARSRFAGSGDCRGVPPPDPWLCCRLCGLPRALVTAFALFELVAVLEAIPPIDPGPRPLLLSDLALPCVEEVG